MVHITAELDYPAFVYPEPQLSDKGRQLRMGQTAQCHLCDSACVQFVYMSCIQTVHKQSHMTTDKGMTDVANSELTMILPSFNRSHHKLLHYNYS